MPNVPTLPTPGNPNPCTALAAELHEAARVARRIGERRLARRLFARVHNMTAAAGLTCRE